LSHSLQASGFRPQALVVPFASRAEASAMGPS
jgi:hypothetical protein